MAGYGQTFTPQNTGRVLILVTVEASNDTLGNGVILKINYGTDTPPSALTPVTGIQASPMINATVPGTNGILVVTLFAIITTLSIGTNYWLDIAFKAAPGGTAKVRIKGCTVVEF